MRYLGENPWHRLEKIHQRVGGTSKLTALSRGRNLYGYAPYPDSIIDGFFKNAVSSGLDIMRIFDALNDVDNIKSSVKSIKKYGGMADCAVCYTIDPKYDDEIKIVEKKGFLGLFSKKEEIVVKREPVFTDKYFLNKAKEMEALGADMITIKDMSGLIPPSKVASLMSLFKKELKVPVDFHTHCTPGFGLGSVLTAIMYDVDVVDTNIWYFSGGPAAPAIELIYVFCQKLGIELDLNMEAVAKINKELAEIRKELASFDTGKKFPNPFNPLTDKLPAEIDKEFDKAIEAVRREDEDALLAACYAIEAYFGFPEPDEMVRKAEVPGGMYTNMVAQLKQFNSMDILEDAMHLIPSVRLDSGLPPLVTPTSQIVGVQAVNSALNIKNGRPKYANPSNQFIALVKGEYGKTPVPVDPKFREKITGSPQEKPYDTSGYKRQDNPVLPEFGNVKLAKDEKDELLLELFPAVATNYLKGIRENEYKTNPHQVQVAENKVEAKKVTVAEVKQPAGKKMKSPLPGTILKVDVKVGDEVKDGQTLFILEAMKMENNITSEFSGKVLNVFVKQGQIVPEGAPLVEIAIA